MTRQVSILKADGSREFFAREKLEESLKKVGADPATVERIVSHIEKELMDDMSTTDIYHHAFALLREQQKPVAARYSLRRALVGFGPTGFPFEEYLAEVFRSKGFSAETDKVVQGKCVPHEVDVVLYNDKELIMTEVKFHNELGYKSDLKVALYVKARFDDLKTCSFSFGGKMRPMTDGWLITNTKFSQTAIDYGECAGMHMIGWNYPEKGNLENLIEESGLHPLSCLSTLGNAQKQELFKKNVVLCKTVKENPSLLNDLRLTQDEIRDVLEEVEGLVIN